MAAWISNYLPSLTAFDSGASVDKLQEVLDSIDVDGDGRVSMEELREAIQKSGGDDAEGVLLRRQLMVECYDTMLLKMEAAVEDILEATGKVVRLRKAEFALLKLLEHARDYMIAVLQSETGDRQLLQSIFGGDCLRITRTRAVLDGVQFSSMHDADMRPSTCRTACESIEQVLQDLGLGFALRQAQEAMKARMQALSECTTDGFDGAANLHGGVPPVEGVALAAEASGSHPAAGAGAPIASASNGYASAPGPATDKAKRPRHRWNGELSPEAMDRIIEQLEMDVRRATNAGELSMVKRQKVEFDLLQSIESARDFMLAVLVDESNNRKLLRDIFGGDCTRVPRVVAALDAVQLSEMHAGDKRPAGCREACDSIKQVLEDVGFADQLRQAQAAMNRRMARIATVKSVKPQPGQRASLLQNVEEDEEELEPVEPCTGVMGSLASFVKSSSSSANGASTTQSTGYEASPSNGQAAVAARPSAFSTGSPDPQEADTNGRTEAVVEKPEDVVMQPAEREAPRQKTVYDTIDNIPTPPSSDDEGVVADDGRKQLEETIGAKEKQKKATKAKVKAKPKATANANANTGSSGKDNGAFGKPPKKDGGGPKTRIQLGGIQVTVGATAKGKLLHHY
eukprot:TRINITY_DN27407_c0_g1_i5.p1 TRINITY_DN27407_c0_g1~~TRINITY_DN27407_c0_g1_i5.p1  ORF type:complete len:627 (+),score=158.55 TRINITY_DN27407_c0_g1_i5:107-1987(+)